MSPVRSSKRSPGLLSVAAALAVAALTAGCAGGGVGGMFAIGHNERAAPAAAQATDDVPVEPLAVAEPERTLLSRDDYPNLNIAPAVPGGTVLTPAEQKSAGEELRERAARIARGDGPLLQHMEQQSTALRQQVRELSSNGDEATPACAEAAAEDCPR